MTQWRETLPKDLLASVVVFLVALPLCMGIAIASGLPPALGLVTGIIGGIVVGSISGSPLQVSGPAAGLAVIVWEIVQDHGIAALGPILILAGLVQMLAGVLKVGQWFRAISPAVVYGMLAGIGVLIFVGQFHSMVDDKPHGSGLQNLISIPSAVVKGIFPVDGSAHHIAAVLGVMTIGIIVLWNKYRPRRFAAIPGALLAVTAATIIAAVLRLPIEYVKVPENLSSVLTFPTWGILAMLQDPAVVVTAFAVAFVASAETLLSAAAVDRLARGVRTNYDRELTAQGVGNLLCGLVGALPMTGVIVRSSANVQAGARTRSSAMLHGVWLLAFVAAVPGVLRMVPVCSLAALLVYTGYKLVDWKSVKALHAYGRMPVAIYAATVIGIVATDLLTGVLIGIALSIAKVIYQVSHLALHVTPAPDNCRTDLHLEGAATFLRLPALAKILDRIQAGHELHIHIDDLAYIDHTCLDLFSNWAKQQELTGGCLVVEWDRLRHRYDRPVALGAFRRAAQQYPGPPIATHEV